MNNNSVQFRHSVIYGAIAGGFIVFLLFIVFLFGMLNNTVLTSFSPMIYIFGAYFSVRHYRDRLCGGYVTFGKAFGTSLITCVTMGTIWGIYSYILYKYLSPGLMKEAIELSEEVLLNKGFSEEFVELATKSTNPFTLSFGYITNSFLLGSLLSLFIAAILKRNVNPLLIDNDQNL
jgi:hypothetical protein